MRYELTPAVERAIEVARRWALARGADEVLPLHLLAGLLDEEEGRAAALATEAGLDFAAWRAEQGTIPESEPGAVLELASSTRAVFAEAREMAANLLGEHAISTESLLAALVEHDSDVEQALADHALDPARLQEIVLGLAAPPLQMDEPLHLRDSAEQHDTARILDAAANRAREALRVVEDYCRFALNDALLCRELKEIRHQLTQALSVIPPALLLQSRDTSGDVGTNIGTASEYTRHALIEVAQANLKRLQESLRTLEECGKLYGAALAQQLEQLRYRSYTLERAIVPGTEARQKLVQCAVQVLVTGSLCINSLEVTIKESAAGGADIIQLREKELNDRELLARAQQVRRWTREAGLLLLINDRPDIARLAEADGVHVGQIDLPVREVRRLLGPEPLIGVSTRNLTQLRQAILDGASHVGVGPMFPSQTKHFEEFSGLEYLKQASGETSLPAFAIGGINARNLAEAVAAGARRIAVSNAVCQANDPRAAVVELRRLLAVSDEERR